MAQSGTTQVMHRTLSVARKGLARGFGAVQPDFPAPMQQAERRRLSHVRQMLLAAAMASGGIVAVAAVMMLGAL